MIHQNKQQTRTPELNNKGQFQAIIAQVLTLPVDQMCIDSSFAKNGGSSELAQSAVSQINEAFDVKLKPDSIVKFDSIERLWQEVERCIKYLPKGLPLALRPEGIGLPLFCIHPSSGFGRPYNGLVEHLPAQTPLYAIEAKGLDDSDKLPETLDQMCDSYISQIQQIQPKGPYRLCGWSFGAIPAHAIAVEMQNRGLQVSGLIILDGFPFDGSPWLDELVNSHRSHWQKEIHNYRELDLVSETRKETILNRLCAIKRNNVLLQRYEKPGKFQGDAVLIKSIESSQAGSKMFPWHQFISGQTKILEVPHGHNVLLSSEVAALYGPEITQYLGSTSKQLQ